MTLLGTGARRDVSDPRDWPLSRLALAALDVDADLSRAECPIRDQGRTSTCVGQSLAAGIQLAFLVGDAEPCPVLSALDPYFGARVLEGGPLRDNGAMPRLALEAVRAHGITTEAAWPFDLGRINDRPSWGARREGYPRRGVRGYYSCSGSVQIALALRNRRPVQACWDVTTGFQKLRGHDVVSEMAGDIVGGHAMLVVGVETVGGAMRFRVQNSWGRTWGNGGFWTASAALIDRAHDCRALDV